MTRVAGIVLAGGEASRFGRDKLAELLDGRPLLDHAILALAAVVDEVVIVRAHLADPAGAAPPAAPRGLRVPLRVVRDATPGGGPLVGLEAGLVALDPASVDVAIVVAGDMPRLVPAVLERLVSELVDRPSIAALTLVAERPSPLPMAIRPGPAVIAVRETLAAGRRSLLALLDRLPAATLAAAAWRPLDPGGLTLSDVDRPSDLPAADG